MGLDMYLSAKKYLSRFDDKEKEIAETVQGLINSPKPVQEIVVRAAYWRKANQIHAWFVDNVQGGEDDCRSYWVSKEQIKELLDLCRKIKDDPENAEDLLPPREGFFFGSYAIDDGYMQDLDDTIEQLEPLLSDAFEHYSFEYQSSW
jgi:hypothetical protein